MGLTCIPSWTPRPRLLPRPRPRSFFYPHLSSFAIWTNSSLTNVASIGCGDDATSNTMGGVDGTSIGVIRVSSTGGGLMSVDDASPRTNVCVVLLVWAAPFLVHTPPDRVMDDIGCWWGGRLPLMWAHSLLVHTLLDWVMDDIGCWWGGGLMSFNGCTQVTTGVCLISLVRGPCRVGRTSPDRGWSCVVASTLNGASKWSISCMASNTYIVCECGNHLEVQYHISGVCW